MGAANKAVNFLNVYKTYRKDLLGMNDEIIPKVINLIQDFRKQVVDRVMWEAHLDQKATVSLQSLPFLTQTIQDQSTDLQSKVRALLSRYFMKSFAMGSSLVNQSLRAASIEHQGTALDYQSLADLIDDTSVVFSSLSEEMIRQTSLELQKSALGFQNAVVTASKISKEIYQDFGYKVKEITTTEIMKAFSMAHQDSSEGLLRSIPEATKIWYADGSENVRRGHRDAASTYSEGGSIGPIPITSTFRVIDYSRTGESQFMTVGGASGRGPVRVIMTGTYERRGSLTVDEMLYPRDPNASAGNVIGCRCISINVIPELKEAQLRAVQVLDGE